MLAEAHVLKDAAGHTMEELTGVCRQETCCAEKALKNGSVKGRDQGAAWDLVMLRTAEAALGVVCSEPRRLGQQSPGRKLFLLLGTPAPCWTSTLAGTSLERGMSRGRGTTAGLGGSGQHHPGQSTFPPVPVSLRPGGDIPAPADCQLLGMQTPCRRHCCLRNSSIPMASKVL